MPEWSKIAVFNLPQDAYLAKALLESNDIIVFLQDELTTQIVNFYSPALGGVKLLVPTKDIEAAIFILKEGGYL